jgi:hypothetical protein
MRSEMNTERNAIASLRAEWARLDTPGRIQGLAERHLALQPAVPTQFDTFDRLPDRPPAAAPAPVGDPIGAMLEKTPETTGSVSAPAPAPR